ncbi:MAG: molybdopterin-synthase adenylyltransferase MoeB [Rhodobacter sp.]|nr:molybdopterin-synthase adenylyltransferase MoeB [Rhodobacter sp.]
MIWVLLAAVALWLLGGKFAVSSRARWASLGALYGLVLGLLVLLPADHPLAVALGGTAGEWLVFGALGLAIYAYRHVLGKLKARAQPLAEPVRPGAYQATELERYARHIMLREIGGPGQKKLKAARVLVVGAGGLGSPALMYLAAAGVGTIGVIDDDVVEATNLQRQIAHTDARIGMPKVFSAEAAMKAVNPCVTVRPYHRRLAADMAADLLADYDIVLDGTDNFSTRYLVNATCVAAGKPLVSGALTQWEGQISVFDPASGAPCYQCVFPEAPADGLAPTCAEAGVLGPLPGVIGAMMAVEAVKVIVGAGEPLLGRMMIYDALYGESRNIRVQRRPGCETCGRLQAR